MIDCLVDRAHGGLIPDDRVGHVPQESERRPYQQAQSQGDAHVAGGTGPDRVVRHDGGTEHARRDGDDVGGDVLQLR